MTDATAPGKIMFVGEYAVLDGAPAIVVSTDVRARAKVVATPGAESVFFDAASGQAFYFVVEGGTGLRWIGEPPGMSGTILEAVVSSCVERSMMLDDGPSFRVSMNTDDFFSHIGGRWTKLGVGSSAAVLVALVGALLAELSLTMTSAELLALCHAAHRRFQGGRGSGADVASAVYGGVIAARGGTEPDGVSVSSCAWPNDLLAMPVWSGMSASTPDLLARFEIFRNDRPDECRRHMRRLKALSEQACVAWSEQSVIDILSALAGYDDALRAFDTDARIGIGTPQHARIRQLVERHGAVYKTSGAGGGDLGLALTDSASVLESVRADCTENGFPVLDRRFAVDGLAIL